MSVRIVIDRDPRMNPEAGDVLHRWDQNFLITRVDQGCVFSTPSLSAYKAWVGILFYREWAAGSEVVHCTKDALSQDLQK